MRLGKKYFHLKSNAVYNSSAKNKRKSLEIDENVEVLDVSTFENCLPRAAARDNLYL